MSFFYDKINITKKSVFINGHNVNITIFEWLNHQDLQYLTNKLLKKKIIFIFLDAMYQSVVDPLIKAIETEGRQIQWIKCENKKIIYKAKLQKLSYSIEIMAVMVVILSIYLSYLGSELEIVSHYYQKQLATVKQINKRPPYQRDTNINRFQNTLNQFFSQQMVIESIFISFPNKIKLTFYSQLENIKLSAGMKLMSLKQLNTTTKGGHYEIILHI